MTVTHNSNEIILGRKEIDDVDAILAVPLVDPNEVLHVLKNNADTIFTWDYNNDRQQLHKLYEKAKVGQWNGRVSSVYLQPCHFDIPVFFCKFPDDIKFIVNFNEINTFIKLCKI